MMPSGHVAVTGLVACRWMKGGSFLLFALLSFFFHFVMDLVPHIDPASLGYSGFLDPTSWVFWWVTLDFLGGFIFTWLLSETFSEYQEMIWVGFFFSLLPDILQTVVTTFPDGSLWQSLIKVSHQAIHDVWRQNLPSEVSISLGVANTLIAWWASYKLLPKSRSIWWMFES